MNDTAAAKEILLEVLKIAREEGASEEARLGRPLTEAEAGRIAAMIERQLRTALVMAR
jgi:hypothetical protein